MKIIIFCIFLFQPLYSSGPGGDDWVYKEHTYSRPDWWKTEWPPKNWGQFVSDWNHNNPGEPFPFHGQGDEFYITPASETIGGAQAKHQDTVRCANCFNLGFYPVASAGLDYDRNRYIVYLGSDEVIGDDFISPKSGTMVGPFLVAEFGVFRADIGFKGVMGTEFIGGIGIGLSLKGSTGYESVRIATTIEEAKKMKRLRSIPRTFRDFEQLPIGTIIISKLSGAIAFQASAVAGFVASAGVDIVAEGDWMVKLAKANNYEAIVSINDVKGGQINFRTGLGFAGLSGKRGKKQNVFFSFQINLDEEEGIAAYENFFKGKIVSIQQIARRNKKLIQELKTGQFDDRLYKPLMKVKSRSKARARDASIGVPFLGSVTRNFGTESFVEEDLRFLSDQDVTAFGPVENGTWVHSFRGSFNTGKASAGLLSRHRERIKEFNVKIEDVKFPDDFLGERHGEETDSSFRRILSKFEYKFHKNHWNQKDWREELKFMARRTGFKDQIIANLPNPIGKKSIDFAEFQANLKISEKALRTLADLVSHDRKAFNDRIIRLANFNLEKWFNNPENQNYEQCDNLIACKRRTSRNTEDSVNLAIKGLIDVGKNFEKLDLENDDRTKKDLVKSIVRFGKGMIKNQFSVGAFLQELNTIRINNRENDFAYCIQWKGSDFKEGQFTLYPSLLRKDRNECYLKEDFQIDEIAKKHDRDLFGSEFILD